MVGSTVISSTWAGIDLWYWLWLGSWKSGSRKGKKNADEDRKLHDGRAWKRIDVVDAELIVLE
jgi:hypothetical protein